MIHDRRNSDIRKEYLLGGLTHSEELAVHLKKAIISPEKVFACMRITEKAYLLKHDFYNQFLRNLSSPLAGS